MPLGVHVFQKPLGQNPLHKFDGNLNQGPLEYGMTNENNVTLDNLLLLR